MVGREWDRKRATVRTRELWRERGRNVRPIATNEKEGTERRVEIDRRSSAEDSKHTAAVL
jgi:hypothetical protein